MSQFRKIEHNCRQKEAHVLFELPTSVWIFFFFRLYLVSFTRVLYNGKQTWKTVTNSFKNLSWVLAGNDLKSSFSCFTILLHKPGLTEMLSEYQIAVFYWSALSLEGMNRSFSILWCSYTCTKEANWGHNVSLLVVKHV